MDIQTGTFGTPRRSARRRTEVLRREMTFYDLDGIGPLTCEAFAGYVRARRSVNFVTST